MKCVVILVAVVAVGHCLFIDDKLSSADDVLGDILSESNSELRTRAVSKETDYERFVNGIFPIIDRNGDGQISPVEYAKQSTVGNWRERLERAKTKVASMDTDGDSQVSKAEMLRYVETKYGRK